MSYTVTILGLSVLALLLAGYLGQMYLPPPTPKIAGIDLGTTYSCIAVYESVTGKVFVLPTLNGSKTIPSVVSFENDSNILVGDDALVQAEQNPQSTIFDAKRFIGKIFSDDEFNREAKNYPFKLGKKDGFVHFIINTKGKYFLVTPEMVGSKIIAFLKKSAEAKLGIGINKAVMAVPAEFDELQRNYTKLAAKLAGIEILRIISEPTAAALAYGLHKKDSIQNVMVVDIGGGTSDISLLNIQGGMFSVQSMAGNSHLGGQDFNQRLFQFLTEIIESKSQKKFSNPTDFQVLRLAVEKAKIELTKNEWTLLNIPLVILDQKSFTYNITRKTFEELNEDLFQKIVTILDVVLENINILPEDVDEIVLVGGSTRIPKIRTLLTNYFNKKPNTGIDPELAVAYGVAIQAGIIGGMWPLTVSAIEIPMKMKKIHIN